MKLKYLVVVEKTDTGYSAFLPDLPGFIKKASTREEIEANIEEAIILHLEGLEKNGMDIPMPNAQALKVSVCKCEA